MSRFLEGNEKEKIEDITCVLKTSGQGDFSKLAGGGSHNSRKL